MFVEIEFAVALVGGNHEIVLVGQGDELLQCVHRYQRAGRVAWRAQEQDLAAFPGLGRDGIEVRVETVAVQARQVVRRGAGEQGSAFIDLVERVGADDQAVGATVDYRLGEGEQCFTGAIDRQYMFVGIQPAAWYTETLLAPASDGLTQGWQADGRRIHRHLLKVLGQGLSDERRRFMLGLTDRQGNGAFVGGRLDAAEQGAKFLERVGLKLKQIGVHRRWVSSNVKWSGGKRLSQRPGRRAIARRWHPAGGCTAVGRTAAGCRHR
ncbi:hypothetical protein D3C80_573070 [compost metagenome]